MEPYKQDSLNSIENSTYRTAFKLRSVQTLCQLDLIDSSLIQQVLLHQSLWEIRNHSLSVEQLFQALQDLFQRVNMKKPGQVDPRSSELTLSLLTAMYDSIGTGFLQLVPAVAALLALSGDCPLTKYKALFQLYTENSKGSYDSGTRMTRRTLRTLLTDLQQLPAIVGESRALDSVESATRSCFQGVLSPAIKEEKFLSWLQSEPPILLWLPTCYRLSVTGMTTHPVRCKICRLFPITGLRYRCLKCLNFDICQACFLSGLHSKSHQLSHPVIEHSDQQVSARENTKLLLKALRNNLLQGHYWRKDASRRQWVDHVNLKDMGNHPQIHSKMPLYGRSAGPTTTTSCKPVSQTLVSQAQQTNDSSPHQQTIISIRNELWKTRESISTLNNDRKLLKKQLNHHKRKLQAIYASQERKSYKFESKIHELTTNQDNLWTKLQQMSRDLQVLLQSLQTSSSPCQNMAPKSDQRKDERLQRGRNPSQIKKAIDRGSEWAPHLKVTTVYSSQAVSQPALPTSESPETTWQLKSMQNSWAQGQPQKNSNTTLHALSIDSSQGGMQQSKPQSAPAEMNNLEPASRKETKHIQEGEDEKREEELQALLSNLMDAFTLETPSGSQSSVHLDLYCGAERVGRAFSALVNHVTMPNLK